MYNLLFRYEYVVVVPAREPADITEPVALTRDLFVDVRARTARLFVVLVAVFDLFLDTTLRVDAFVVRVGVIEREETFLPAVPRDAVVLDAV